ncbi:ABC transporter permease [Actinocorallia sp. API 0066]|uniref:ABC transporter permease n=1 Tax=Actinocorallia sp. API 0066 TaxID=2896846 RepID=UPI001E5D8775|nr:ABC transporter permease [Actinocorallia sp. API 0066]MCD0453373.1 ABC transporter permease [Actinocorallia sp. API 0066]
MWLAPERRGRQGWVVPVFAMLAGVGVAGLLVYREEAVAGLIAGAVLLGYGIQLAYRRDERGLAVSESFGRGRSGRSHLRAAAMTGDVLVAGLVAAVVVQALRGAELGPLPYLAAVAGLTYIVSIVVAGDF